MNTLRLSIAAALLTFGAMLPQASADQTRSSLDCLPAETVLALRMPSGRQALEHLRANTRFGSVVLSKQRWDKAMLLLQSENQNEWEGFEQGLAQVGLEVDDLNHLFDGEVGYGLILEPRQDATPLIIGVAWTSPGEALAEKYMTAISKTVAMVNEEADEDRKARRSDIEVAGHEVMHVAVPKITTRYDWGTQNNDDAPRKFKKVTSQDDQINFFITRVGGRVVLMHTLPLNKGLIEGDDAPDFDKISGVEQATQVLARFLQAHAGDAPEDAFAARMLATPGLADAMPNGRSLIEVYGDPKPLWQLLDQADVPNAEQVKQYAAALGLNDVGPMAFRWTFQGEALHGGAFLSAPAPRRGLLKLLDQPPVKPGVPAWVPASAFDYTHFSFDLGAAWTLGKGMAVEMVGEKATAFIDQVELQVQTFAQTDLASVLSGLGTRHTVVRFEPISTPGGGLQKEGDMTRAAIVWQLQDEPTWQQIMTGLTPFTMMTEGAVAPTDEQGFTGFRLQDPNQQMDASLMIGKGYLAFNMGNGVTAPMLNALRNPPTGEGALRNTAGYQRFGQMFEAKPGLTYNYFNGDQVVSVLYGMIMDELESAAEHDDDVARVLTLLPKRDEVEGTLGVGGGHTLVNEHGVASHSLIELPPADE